MEENYVKGTCQFMCPVKEAKLRQKENLLHKFEIKNGTESNRRPEYDQDKVIKSFSRSAAGVDTTNPSNLRPFEVLLKTNEYLFVEIFPRHKEKPLLVYNFMFDRFRAVRQDAVIQNLPAGNLVQILEPIVRFLIYFGYILGEEKEFDAHINNTHLQECLKRLLVCYDELSENQENQWEMESLYLLFNLGNIKPLTRGIRLCGVFPNKHFINSFRLSLQWYLKNYKRVFELIRTLPPLLSCVVTSTIPDIRRYCLQAMSNAYSSANSSYPISRLRRLLLFENDSEVMAECSHFNIEVSDGAVHFLKKNYDISARTRNRVRLKWIDDKLLECDLVRLMRFGDCT